MLGHGTIGQYAVGQFSDLSSMGGTPTEDTETERKPLLRRATSARTASFWKGRP